MNEQAREFHIEVNAWKASSSPVGLIAEAAGDLSRQTIKDAMGKGAVWLSRSGNTRRLRRHKAPLKAGDQLHLYYDPEVLNQQAAPATLVADEGDFSVWDKPPGMLSQGSKWGDHTTIIRFAETQLQRVSFLVHRLDRAASGLILVAHSKRSARELTGLFEARKVEKIYQVCVSGHFPTPPQHYDAPLDGRPASSHATLVSYDPSSNTSLLEVNIDTGRKHQIRRHLETAGFPVAGDSLYGSDTKEQPLQLRAVALRFELHGRRAYSLGGLSGV